MAMAISDKALNYHPHPQARPRTLTPPATPALLTPVTLPPATPPLETLPPATLPPAALPPAAPVSMTLTLE